MWPRPNQWNLSFDGDKTGNREISVSIVLRPGKLSMLNNQRVVGVALALYVIEFAEDKIPLLDSAWDLVHTLIQIPASTALAAA